MLRSWLRLVLLCSSSSIAGAIGCSAPAPPPRPAAAEAATPAPAATSVAPAAPATAAVAPAPTPAALPPCPVPAPGSPAGPLLTPEALAAAVQRLDRAAVTPALTAALGVDCQAEQPSFAPAFVQAVARFQRRYGRFEDDVTGVINARTRRYLEVIQPLLRGPDHPCGQAAASGPLTHLPACHLRWPGADQEQLAFIREVYDFARQRAARKREFVLATDEVEVIEQSPCPGKPAEVDPACRHTTWAQRDAARACAQLLAAARRSFAADAKLHGQRNLLVYTGYRSALFQLEIWEHHIPGRYQQTAAARRRARGGPHGREAAQLLGWYYLARTAVPGYSLHNSGQAIDFGCVTRKGDWIGSNGSFIKAWQSSYCLRWLKQHAGRFGFVQNKKINEPWHWEFHGGQEPAPSAEQKNRTAPAASR